MGKIQLTPSELLSQGIEMEELMHRYEDMFLGVEGVLNSTNSNWSANLSNNFSDKIKSAQNSFRTIVEMLQFGSEAAKNSANSFESIDSLLSKNMNLSDLIKGASGVAGALSSMGDESGASKNILSGSDDEEKKKDADALFKWVEKAAGVSGKIFNGLIDDADAGSVFEKTIAGKILSPIVWIKDSVDAYHDAKTEGVAAKDLVDLFGGGAGAFEDFLDLVEKFKHMDEGSLNSGFLGKLKTFADIIGLGFDEWEALKDGTYEGFINKIDDVIDDIGSVTLGVGKWLDIVPKGFSGYCEANNMLTAFKGFASFGIHTVGGTIQAFQDGSMSWEEASTILLDSGSHAGDALVKGLTFGLINIDADSAVGLYQKNAEAVVNYVDSCGGSTATQIAVGIVSSPFVFVGTTAQLIMETQPAKMLGQGAEWLEGKLYSGLESIFS